jgi:hypothetical protein
MCGVGWSGGCLTRGGRPPLRTHARVCGLCWRAPPCCPTALLPNCAHVPHVPHMHTHRYDLENSTQAAAYRSYRTGACAPLLGAAVARLLLPMRNLTQVCMYNIYIYISIIYRRITLPSHMYNLTQVYLAGMAGRPALHKSVFPHPSLQIVSRSGMAGPPS